MTDKIEKQNIEVGAGGAEGAKKEYIPFNPETIKEEKKDVSKEEKALEEAFDTSKGTSKTDTKETENLPGKTPKDIHEIIQNLHRPEAAKGIEQSYQNTQKDMDEIRQKIDKTTWLPGRAKKAMKRPFSG